MAERDEEQDQIKGMEVTKEPDGSLYQLTATNEKLGVKMSVIHPSARFGGGKDMTMLEFYFSKDGRGIGPTGGTENIRVAEMLGEEDDRKFEPDMIEELLVQKYAGKFLGLTEYGDITDLLNRVFPDIAEKKPGKSF